MIVQPDQLTAEQSYRLLTGVVVPRPIAWITTLNTRGRVNLAPFSAFTFVAPKPPMLGVSIGRKGDVYKDTARNILAREEYVVHIADSIRIAELHASSEELPELESEVEMLGLETTAGDCVSVPRLTDVPVAMECRLRHVMEFGDLGSRFIVGEVLRYHIRDGLLCDGKIQTMELDPICRLGGPNYATLGETVTMSPIRQTPKTERT